MTSAGEIFLSGPRGAKYFRSRFGSFFGSFFSCFSNRFSDRFKSFSGVVSFCRHAPLKSFCGVSILSCEFGPPHGTCEFSDKEGRFISHQSIPHSVPAGHTSRIPHVLHPFLGPPETGKLRQNKQNQAHAPGKSSVHKSAAERLSL